MGFDIFLLPEYITASREKIMKKKIIILTSIFVFLSLVGGGITAYYFSYLPMKKEAEEKFDRIMANYIDEYFTLLEQNKFIEAQDLLKDYRSFLNIDKSDKQLLAYFYSFIMENSLWYMQKDYEKMKVNFPGMEQLLKKVENSKLSKKEILTAKWNFFTNKYEYFYYTKAYGKAIDIIESFIKDAGGEKKLEEMKFYLLFTIYSYKANCLQQLGKTQESIKYNQKALLVTEDPAAQHRIYLNLATLEINRENIPVACKYTLKASEKSTSQKGYFCLALVHLKQGRKEEAKKYYSLALTCKKFPVVLEEDLTNLKKKLFQ